MSENHVYAVAAEDGPVKIGRAQDPQARLKGLQTSSPQHLRLAYALQCGQREAHFIEMAAHQSLKAKRLLGEWFAVSPEEAIAAIDAAFAAICENPVELHSRPREPKMTTILRSICPLQNKDVELFDEIISRAMKGGKSLGYGLEISVDRHSITFDSSELLIASLERLRRFPVFWNDDSGRTFFNAITTFGEISDIGITVIVSGCLVEMAARLGKEKLIESLKEQVSKITSLKQKDAAS